MKNLLLIIITIALVALAAAMYMGAFSRVDIAEQVRGPFTLVYRDMAAGDLNKVGEITTALDSVLGSAGLEHRKPLDVYFPDGRGEIGFAVEAASPEQLTALGDQAKVKEIPAQQFMVTEFPWRNPMSFMVGFYKVDPALADYRLAHGYRKVEALALNDGDVIVYMQPIVRQ